jgi:hypothetical protein
MQDERGELMGHSRVNVGCLLPLPTPGPVVLLGWKNTQGDGSCHLCPLSSWLGSFPETCEDPWLSIRQSDVCSGSSKDWGLMLAFKSLPTSLVGQRGWRHGIPNVSWLGFWSRRAGGEQGVGPGKPTWVRTSLRTSCWCVRAGLDLLLDRKVCRVVRRYTS